MHQDLESKFPAGCGLLLITVTEDEGRRVEQQSFEQTKAEVVEMLRGVYGPNIPEPTGSVIIIILHHDHHHDAYIISYIGISLPH